MQEETQYSLLELDVQALESYKVEQQVKSNINLLNKLDKHVDFFQDPNMLNAVYTLNSISARFLRLIIEKFK